MRMHSILHDLNSYVDFSSMFEKSATVIGRETDSISSSWHSERMDVETASCGISLGKSSLPEPNIDMTVPKVDTVPQ